MGLKLRDLDPTQITRGASNIFSGATRDISSVGKGLENTWRNLGRGEIGKWAGGLGQSVYNFTIEPVNVVTGKDTLSQGVQKWAGSAANIYTTGAASYVGQSSGVQRLLKEADPYTLGFSGDVAAATHGVRTMGNDAVLSNYDRNRAIQGTVKAGVAYGAYAAGSAWAASGSAEGVTAAEAASTQSGVGIAASESASVGFVAEGATAGTAATAAAASSTPWLAYGGTAALGVGVLTGKKNASDVLREITSPGAGVGEGGWWDAINGIVSGIGGSKSPASGGSQPASWFADSIVNPDGTYPTYSTAAMGSGVMLAIGAAALFLAYKKGLV